MRKSDPRIVLATHNPHKVVELTVALKGLDVVIMTLNEFPEIGEIPETGETLKENSLLKARTVHDLTHLPAIADDTGLEVDALDGAPGVYSARYAGEEATYNDNVRKLLQVMERVSKEDRSARFRSVVSYVDKDQEITAEGMINGFITESPRGDQGFGYDPVFLVPEKKKTFAELSTEEKNTISHRGIALQNLRKLLVERVFTQTSNLWSHI